MAKGGGGRGLSSSSTGNNGGILGTGIFGMFGTTIRCDAESTSTFCQIMKAFNIFMVICIVAFVLYTIFHLVYPMLMAKKSK